MPAYSRCLLDKIEKQKPMAFNNEEKFENALIEMLSKKGWEKEVLRHPTEKDLLKNYLINGLRFVIKILKKVNLVNIKKMLEI